MDDGGWLLVLYLILYSLSTLPYSLPTTLVLFMFRDAPDGHRQANNLAHCPMLG